MGYALADVARYSKERSDVAVSVDREDWQSAYGGNQVRALIKVFAIMFVLSMLASIGAAAEQYKINKSIYGFYLGESKQVFASTRKNGRSHFQPEGQDTQRTIPR